MRELILILRNMLRGVKSIVLGLRKSRAAMSRFEWPLAIPGADHQPDQLLADVAPAARRDADHLDLRVERPPDGRRQQAGLAAEEVHDQRRIDARLAGDGPRRTARPRHMG
jgi:hypothetical protein